MRVNCRHTLPILVLFGLLTAIQPAQAATVATVATAQPPANPLSVYPQIVRLRYVEGDVRVSRGKLAEKVDAHEQDTARLSANLPDNGGDQTTGWEQAVVNLPLEEGYSLVTGKGRAEIEFEDASTVYLADNSVLTFDQLTTRAGVPTTEMSLLAGTATLDVRTQVPGESFLLTTPTDHVSMRYPQKARVRVDSYLDAVSLTPQQDLTYRLPGMTAARPQVIGQTITYSHGRRIVTPAALTKGTSSEWDTWVADRVEARDTAMSEAMKAAGLAEPVPGLDALDGKGRFFACQPYGMCWEPANGWTAKPEDVAQVDPQGAAVHAAPAQPTPPASASKPAKAAKPAKPSAADTYMASHPSAILHTEDYTFPCVAYPVQDVIATDPVTGKEQIIGSSFDTSGWPYAGPFSPVYPYRMGYPFGVGYYPRRGLSPFLGFDAFDGYYPWDWAVCHAGSWIRWQHHYVWVVGSKRHHHHPVHWVKTGGKLGFVPIHPRDVAGKPPVNLKEGIYRVTGKKDLPIERVRFEEDKPLKLLNDAPKEFRSPDIRPLQIAEAPHAVAHSVYNYNTAAGARGAVQGRGASQDGNASPARGTAIVNPTVARGFASRDQGMPINFDRKSQTFSVARPVIEGGRTATVNEPLGGRGGNFQTGGGSSMARGSSGTSNNGGSSRSYGATPSYGGGGSSRPSAPAPSPSYGGGGGGGYSRPSAPAPSAPAPSYSGGGGSSGGSAGSSNRPK
jgi:hypothetical protein